MDFDSAVEAVEAEGRVISTSRSVTSRDVHALSVIKNPVCRHCRKIGHDKDTCWVLHPELKPLCENCGMRGHWAYNCRKKETRANIVGYGFGFDDAYESDYKDAFVL